MDARVIVNRMDRRANASGLNASDVEAALGPKMAGGIPNNYRLVRDAVDRGVPLEEIEPRNNVTTELSRIILKDAAEEMAVERRSGLLALGRGLFARKSG